MKTPVLAAVFLSLSLGAAPALAQGIPDYIPDEPGEPLVDREKERLAERYRGVLSRFFTGGGLALDPLYAAPTFQASVQAGMRLPGGDAIYAQVSRLESPARLASDTYRPGLRDTDWYVGVGYELRATRLLGSSPVAERSALGLGVGLLAGEVSGAGVEVRPMYDLLVGHGWAVPVGLALSVARVGDGDVWATSASLGLAVGVRWHWLRRDRLE